ncbi:MAG: SprT family zinc-dependent metalloprotease [Bacteroidota bacterium]
MSQTHHIQIGQQEVALRIERTRGRSIRLLYKPELRMFILRTPSGNVDTQARLFLQKQEAWMLKRLQKAELTDKRAIRFHADLEAGLLPFLGEGYQLIRTQGPRRKIERSAESRQIHLTLQAQDEDWKAFLRESLKLLAKDILPDRTFALAKATESTVNKIFIKGQKTRWGSCSNLSNVNLNWHMIFMPPPLIDYVIIHELMHLRELNHSPKFWAWVERYYPNYKQAEKEIRQYEWMIGILD